MARTKTRLDSALVASLGPFSVPWYHDEPVRYFILLGAPFSSQNYRTATRKAARSTAPHSSAASTGRGNQKPGGSNERRVQDSVMADRLGRLIKRGQEK